MARILAQYCAAVRSCNLRSLRNFTCTTPNDIKTCHYRPSTYAFDVIDVIDDMVADMTVLVGANHEYSMIVAAFRGTATLNNIFEDISVQSIPYPSMTTFKLRYTELERSLILNMTRNLQDKLTYTSGNGASHESSNDVVNHIESSTLFGPTLVPI